MRKILMFLVLIVSIKGFGQDKSDVVFNLEWNKHLADFIPANYQYRVVYERLRGLMPDSVFHFPRYNGVPVGLRGGASNEDGAGAVDTLNGNLYIYHNTAWLRMAKFSEVPSATGQLFGFSDTRGTTNRRYSGAGNSFMLDSLDVTIAANDSFYVYDVGGADRIDINRVASRFWSPDGLSKIDIFRDTLDLHLNATSSKLLFSNLSSVAVDTTNYKPVVIGSDERVQKFSSWAGLVGGSTPTLQQVLDAGSTLTSTETILLNSSILNIQQSSLLRTSFNPGGFSQLYDNGTITASTSITPGGILLSKYDTDELGLASSVQLIDSLILKGNHAGFGRESKIVIKDSSIRFTSSLGRYQFPDMPVGPGTHAVRIDATGKLFKADTTTGGTSTFIDNAFTIQDDGDNTKQIQFQASGISTGQTRTLTVPDANGTIALTNVANTWSAGVRQQFSPNGTRAGLNFGSVAGDPSINLVDGDVIYNSVTNKFRGVVSGAYVDFVTGSGGSGTVTSVSVVDANGFTGSVANPTTTPAITLNINSPSFEPWYRVYSNFGYSDQPLFRLSSFGSGSTIGTLNTTTIFDGWEFGLYMETGTTTTGSAYSYGYSSGNVAGIAISNSFRYNVGGLVRLDDLSDGTDTYNYSLGFGDDWGNGVSSIVDGAYFEYTHSLNSGNWTCTTESNGTKTQTDSGIPVVADQDVTLEVSVFNGNAFFYINKTLVATNTTNIPTGTARATSLGHAIAKTAGTTNRKAYCEWFAYGKRSN